MILVSADSDAVRFQAPFHPMLSPRCRALGGRWKGAEVGWTFDRSRESEVREVCLDIFGFDGTEEAAADDVSVRVTVDEALVLRTVFLAHQRPIYLLGREVAAAVPGRHFARAGKGVKFLKDAPRFHPPAAAWCISIPDGAVFEMRAVPRAAVPRLQAALANAGGAEMV